jgi:hypothetical protein
MDIHGFRDALDRFGSAFSVWPLKEVRKGRNLLAVSAEARRAREAARQVEGGIASSRPSIGPDRARAVVAAAMVEIAQREMRSAVGNPFLAMLVSPFLRTALMLSLPAVGFAIGLAVGSPDLSRGGEAPDGLGVAAVSADDGSL